MPTTPRLIHRTALRGRLSVVWMSIMLACAATAGCQHVAPYQRESLAHPAIDAQEREAKYRQFYGHVIEAREGAGALGMSDASGGGCGCN